MRTALLSRFIRRLHDFLCAAACLSAFFLALAFPCPTAHASSPEELWTFSIYFENDLFAGTDRNYTNGTKLSWVSPDLSSYRDSGELPDWAHPLIQCLPFINEEGLIRNVALSIGQNMYTPRETDRRRLVPDDRPYAGWLYGGIAFHSKNVRRLDTIEIQAGVVGPLSFAEETQRVVHRLRDIDVPEGWDNQLSNEPGLVLICERKVRVFERGLTRGPGLDVITHMGVGLGNVSTYANAGAEIRVGWNLPADFGSALIRPAGDTNAPISSTDPRISERKGFSLHLFGAVSGRAVARDIFLDGNTFTDSHSVDKEPFVADVSAGIGVTFDRFKISYAQVLRTREFEGQEEHHSFGSVTLSISY